MLPMNRPMGGPVGIHPHGGDGNPVPPVVRNFMDEVDAEQKKVDEISAFKNSDTYKRNMVNRECERGKEECMKHIVQNCYRNAVPLSDEYKNAMCDDLDNVVDKHCPNGVLFYFKEGIKNGTLSDRCSKIVEAVENEVEKLYGDRKLNPGKYTDESELLFQMDPNTKNIMDDLSRDLSLDDISDIVKRNVQDTTKSEVERAKEQRENDKAIEKELAENMSITSEAAIDKELERRGIAKTNIFDPTVFQGIMIGESSRIGDEVPETYTYLALEDYGMDDGVNSPMYQAMVESVKEYTWFVLENEIFNKKPISGLAKKKLAMEYSRCGGGLVTEALSPELKEALGGPSSNSKSNLNRFQRNAGTRPGIGSSKLDKVDEPELFDVFTVKGGKTSRIISNASTIASYANLSYVDYKQYKSSASPISATFNTKKKGNGLDHICVDGKDIASRNHLEDGTYMVVYKGGFNSKDSFKSNYNRVVDFKKERPTTPVAMDVDFIKPGSCKLYKVG